MFGCEPNASTHNNETIRATKQEPELSANTASKLKSIVASNLIESNKCPVIFSKYQSVSKTLVSAH